MNNLKRARKARHYTQEELSKILGVGRDTYLHWENEDTDMPVSKLKQIAEIFNESVDYLLGMSDFARADIKEIEENRNKKLHDSIQTALQVVEESRKASIF